MRDQRLPDAVTEGATTVDTTPERDDGKPKPDTGLEHRQDRDGSPTEPVQDRAAGRPDAAETDPGGP